MWPTMNVQCGSRVAKKNRKIEKKGKKGKKTSPAPKYTTLYIYIYIFVFFFHFIYLTPGTSSSLLSSRDHVRRSHAHTVVENVVVPCLRNVLLNGGGMEVYLPSLSFSHCLSVSLLPINRTDSYISPAPATLIDSRVYGETEISDRIDIIILYYYF